jgi:hypothetical protein
MRLYIVDLRCRCGQVHRVIKGLVLHGGPTEAGTVAELYGDGELPEALESLLNDLVRCTETGEWVELADRRRVHLRPRREP